MAKCKAYHCGAAIEDGLLMCTKHWALVAQETRLLVKATMRRPESLDHVKAANKAKMEAARRGRFSRQQLARFRKAQKAIEAIVARHEIRQLSEEFSARSAETRVHPSRTNG